MKRTIIGSLTPVVILLIWGVACNSVQDKISQSIQPVFQVRIENQADFESQLLDIINDKRSELGVGKLITTTTLMNVAEAHSMDMSTRNYLAHGSPEGDHAGERLSKAGYNWIYWGEVLAGGDVSPQAVFDGWLGSPLHKAVLLDEAYTEVGLGYSFNPDTKHGHYFTVVLTVPKIEKN